MSRNNEEYYLEITVHDNDFYTYLDVLGNWLAHYILYMDIDLIALGDTYGDEYVVNYCRDLFFKIYELSYKSNPSNRGELDHTLKYLKDNFSFRFILESDISTDGNGEYLYLQLSGVNKGYFFIY